MIPQEAIEAVAKRNYEFNYYECSWAAAPGDVKVNWLEEAQRQVEAAAPFLRAQALEDAADMRFRDGSWVFGLPARQKLRARAFTERERK